MASKRYKLTSSLMMRIASAWKREGAGDRNGEGGNETPTQLKRLHGDRPG